MQKPTLMLMFIHIFIMYKDCFHSKLPYHFLALKLIFKFKQDICSLSYFGKGTGDHKGNN